MTTQTALVTYDVVVTTFYLLVLYFAAKERDTLRAYIAVQGKLLDDNVLAFERIRDIAQKHQWKELYEAIGSPNKYVMVAPKDVQ